MTNVQIKARKLELKKQFFQIRAINRLDRIERSILLGIRRRYEKQMNEAFDPELSKRLECLDFLINQRGPVNEKDFDGSSQIC